MLDLVVLVAMPVVGFGGRSHAAGEAVLTMVVMVVLPGIAVMTLGIAAPALEVKMLTLMMEFWTRKHLTIVFSLRISRFYN